MKGPFSVVLLVASGLVGVSWVGAQDPAKPQEAEAKPAVAAAPSLFPIGYLDHSSLSEALKGIEAANPGRIKIESLAKSREGRDVWIVTIDGRPRTRR